MRWARHGRRISIERRTVGTPELNTRAKLAAGCRLNDKSQSPRELQMPGNTLRVSGPSLEIITRCDGKHTVREIVSALQKLYSKAAPQKVEEDVLEYLARLHDDGAIEFSSGGASASDGER
jgi:hypothetical protein